jgi:DNA-binding IclR family transcriptional regulator
VALREDEELEETTLEEEDIEELAEEELEELIDIELLPPFPQESSKAISKTTPQVRTKGFFIMNKSLSKDTVILALPLSVKAERLIALIKDIFVTMVRKHLKKRPLILRARKYKT